MAKFVLTEWREFLEAYAVVSRYMAVWADGQTVTANNLSVDRVALVRIEHRRPTPLMEGLPPKTAVCLDLRSLMRGAVEGELCEFENIIPRFTPTARARLGERLSFWITEAERIGASHATFEAREGRLRFYALGDCEAECWVEDFAEATGEGKATYVVEYLKAARKARRPVAMLEWATQKPIHIWWEAPRTVFHLYVAPTVD